MSIPALQVTDISQSTLDQLQNHQHQRHRLSLVIGQYPKSCRYFPNDIANLPY
jgi:hypothetical protein